MRKLLLLIALIAMSGCLTKNSTYSDTDLIEVVGEQLTQSIDLYNNLKTAQLVAPRTVDARTIKMVPSSDWTSGFYPGELWMMHELTGDDFWKEKALEFTLPLEQEKYNGRTHDMGVKMFCSFGNAYQATKNPEYKEILLW